MTPTADSCPRLRPLEAFPTASENGPMVVIRDPSGLAGEMLAMSPEAFELVALMDGTRTLGQIREEVRRERGYQVDVSQIAEMVRTLEQHHFLDSAAFASWRAQLERDYVARPVREMALAGHAYPAAREEARDYLSALLARHPGGDEARAREMCALVAPHIDLERGAPGFGAAYGTYARAEPFDAVVILGTGHYAEKGRFMVSTQRFQTPFGTLGADRALIESLGQLYHGDLVGDRLAHRSEHSIEFQALFLAGVAWRDGGFDQAARAPSIVPILATTFDDLMQRDIAPWEYPEVADFVAALTEAVTRDERRVLLLAGADLSHVGERFGDREAARDGPAARAEQVDRAALECLTRGDARALFETVAAGGNATRICSLPSLYTVLAASGATGADLLHYGQALDDDGGAMVSFASLVLHNLSGARGGRCG